MSLASLDLLKVNWFHILVFPDPSRETDSTSCIPVCTRPPTPAHCPASMPHPACSIADPRGQKRGAEGPRLNLRRAPLSGLCQEGEAPEALRGREGGRQGATPALVALRGLSLRETTCATWAHPKAALHIYAPESVRVFTH